MNARMPPALTIKNILAIVIGNALEWYDFVVYSFMTIIIAQLFFPNKNEVTSLLVATATFGVAFCMRPLGGVVFGLYADKKGRKAAVIKIIWMMTIAILLISLVPTYATIGVLAPIIIVIARLLQGFSAGGEFSTSTALLVELAPAHQRGFYSSWIMVGQMFSILLGATVGMLLTQTLTFNQISAWGWRIPFLFGLIIAPVGIYIRRHLDETYVNRNANISNMDLSKRITKHKRELIVAMGLVVGGTVSTYTNISFMPTYVQKYLHMTIHDSFVALFIATFVMIILMPLFGKLSDQIGRKTILVISILFYFFSIYPLFTWINTSPSLSKLIIIQVIFCVLLSAYFGVFAVIIAELFPKEIRSTGLGISYNLTVMLFGGFAQFIVTWLINITASSLAITYYLLFSIFISLIAALFYQDKGVNSEYD